MMRLILGVMVLAIVFSLNGCDDKSSFVPKTNLAQEYTIIKTFEYATPADKKGLEITIYSKNSTTFEKRAQTAAKAAIDILEEKGLYEIIIKMNTSNNMQEFNLMAYVQYNPYKKDTWGEDTKYIWSIEASDNDIQNGQLVEKGKSYPISYISVKKYLKK